MALFNNFVDLVSNQIIGGNKTLSGTTKLTALSASTVLSLNASKEIQTVNLNLTDPVSFTAPFTTWTPTFTASGGMTFSANTSTAKYAQIGKLVFFVIRAELTTATAAGLRISFTVPVTADSTLTAGGGIIAGDGAIFAGSWGLASTTQIDVRKYDLSNWTTPAAITFQISGFYEAA